MKKSIGFEKRKGKSQTILDVDDFYILYTLLTKKGGVPIEDLKKKLNLSHSALLVHLKRLTKYGWISIWRRKDNYKFKLVDLTNEGRILLIVLIKNKNLKERKEKIPFSPRLDHELREALIGLGLGPALKTIDKLEKSVKGQVESKL